MKKVSAQQMADHLGVTIRWVNQLAVEGKLKKDELGKFDLDLCCKQFYEKKKEVKSGSSEERYETSRADLTEEKARKAKWEADLIEGKALNLEAVREVGSERNHAVKSRLLSIPSKIAPIISDISDAAQCFKIINDAIYEALAELSDPRNVDSYIARYREIVKSQAPEESDLLEINEME